MTGVDVVNVALAMVGETPITSLTPSPATAKSTLANAIYDAELKPLMHATPWNFAVKRASLSPDVDSLGAIVKPTWGYAYQYTVPSDCLRMVRLEDTGIPFRVESGKIICDEATLNVRYIWYNPDPTTWAEHFRLVFIYRLASIFAITLLGNETKSQRLQKLYELALNDAISDNLREGWPEQADSNELIDVRLGGAGGGFPRLVVGYSGTYY